MRRALAALLVALFHFPLAYDALIGPLLLADDHSNLPACCRRDGKHRCAMADDSASPSWQATRCPLYPSNAAVLTSERTAPTEVSGTASTWLVSHHFVGAQITAPHSFRLHRTEPKRGPPVDLQIH